MKGKNKTQHKHEPSPFRFINLHAQRRYVQRRINSIHGSEDILLREGKSGIMSLVPKQSQNES